MIVRLPILILFIFSLCAFSQSIEFDKESKTYKIFNKSCLSVKSDLEKLYRHSISNFICDCSSTNSCSSKVKMEMLPTKISYLLSHRNTKLSGPNCYNSVMYLAGIVPGLYFSTNEIQLWLDSSFCKNINSSELLPGDFVSFQSYESNSGHIMMYLADNIYFNKSMGSKSDPYELVNFKNYMNSYSDGSGEKYKVKCLNLTVEQAMKDEDCRSKYTTAYRCKSLEEEFSEQIKNNPEIWKSYTTWGECLNEYFLNGNEDLLNQIKSMMKILSSYAKNKMDIPSFKSLPENLQRLIKESHSGYNENDYNILAAEYYVSAHVKDSLSLSEVEQAFTQVFSSNYANISIKEMMFWSNIYLGASRDKIGWDQ